MLQFPFWKKALILGICLLGLVVAAPNLFYGRVERANDARAALERGETLTPEMQADLADGRPGCRRG